MAITADFMQKVLEQGGPVLNGRGEVVGISPWLLSSTNSIYYTRGGHGFGKPEPANGHQVLHSG